LNYFKINYFLGSALVFAFFIITNPSSLFVLALIAASWTYVYLVRTEPLKIGEPRKDAGHVRRVHPRYGRTGLSRIPPTV
jgi:hypothetical protein